MAGKPWKLLNGGAQGDRAGQRTAISQLASNAEEEGVALKYIFWLLSACGFVLVGYAVYGVIFDVHDIWTAVFFCIVGLVVVAMTGGHKLGKFGVSSPLFGFTGEVQHVIQEARDLTGELREVMTIAGGEAVRQIVMSGRWGDGSTADKFDREQYVLAAMARVGVPTAEIDAVRDAVRPYHIVDYAQIITEMAEARRSPESNERWNAFFEPFVSSVGRPEPEELRAFMQELGVHDDTMEAWIGDYAHFRRTGEHRRPDEFKHRERLLKRLREERQARRAR